MIWSCDIVIIKELHMLIASMNQKDYKKEKIFKFWICNLKEEYINQTLSSIELNYLDRNCKLFFTCKEFCFFENILSNI